MRSARRRRAAAARVWPPRRRRPRSVLEGDAAVYCVVLAASDGSTLRSIDEDIQRRAAAQHMQEYEGLATRHFTALRRMLDRQEPDYRS